MAARLERTARSLKRERDPWQALPVTDGLRTGAERLRAGDITGASTALATVELEAATLAATDADGPWPAVIDLIRRSLRVLAP